MAVAVQPRSQGTRERGRWPATDELGPIVRLLSSIWTSPRVTKVGATMGEASIDVRVFMGDEDFDAEARVSAAERVYVSAVRPSGFTLHVIPDGRVPEGALPPYETILER